jgi:hypothetical protein
MNFRTSLVLGVSGLCLILSVQSCDRANPLNHQDLNTITDIDGNLYHTIEIGRRHRGIWPGPEGDRPERSEGNAQIRNEQLQEESLPYI